MPQANSIDNPSTQVQERTSGKTLDRILIIDTETTSLSVDQGQLIEVGAILYSVKHQTLLQQCSTLLPALDNPAERINRIKPASLLDMTSALAKKGILMQTQMAEQAELIVAHNAEFDKQWLEWSTFTTNNIVPLKNLNGNPLSWLCTCNDFEWPHQSRPGQSLIDLALAHGIGVTNPHRALTDCQLIAALFDRMENLAAMFDRAMRPKARFSAMVSYENKDLAKQAGFKWMAERKAWERMIALEDVPQLPFGVKQLGQAQSPVRQLGHLAVLSSNSLVAIAS